MNMEQYVKPVIVRKVEIGSGIPKICIANIGTTKTEIIELAKKYVIGSMDLMEWRVDWFEEYKDHKKVIEVLTLLREVLSDIPLLFTFRTNKEGGNASISEMEYQELNTMAAMSGYVDLIDVEIFSTDAVVKNTIEAVHNAGVQIVGSNHDFHNTPLKADLIYRLRKMEDYGADILKIAVMPKDPADVLCLLDATWEMRSSYTTRPLVTMSMAGLGGISRMVGELVGSAITFGSGAVSSAPGQIPTEELAQVLKIMHNSCQKGDIRI